MHIGLLFAADPSDFLAQKIGGGQPRGLIQPAGKDRLPAQTPSFFGEDDEHGLGDFLGGVRIAGFADGDGIDQVEVTRHERRKGRLGILLGILPEQIRVSEFVHPFINVRRRRKVPFYFIKISGGSLIQPNSRTDNPPGAGGG